MQAIVTMYFIFYVLSFDLNGDIASFKVIPVAYDSVTFLIKFGKYLEMKGSITFLR